MVNPETAKSSPARSERLISHALVEIRRYSWWPFGVKSAVLLDLSNEGFKIELTGKATCAIGDSFWMQIPLTPFGITNPSDISLKISVKWFDPKKMRIGGVFENPDNVSKIYLEKIIEKVKDQALNE